MPAPTKSDGTVAELVERASGAQQAVSDALRLVDRCRSQLSASRSALEHAKNAISRHAYGYRNEKSYHSMIDEEISAINKLLGDRP